MTDITIEKIEAIADAALTGDEAAELLAEIDEWCARTGTRDSHFGQMALDFGGFVGLLRKRGSARSRVALIVRNFMTRRPDGVPPGERDAERSAAFNLLFPLRVPDCRRKKASLDAPLERVREMVPDALGASLAAKIRAAAADGGVSLRDFLAPITTNANAWLTMLEKARQPREDTRERIAALLAGRPVPPPAPRRATSIADEVRAEAELAGRRRAAARVDSAFGPASLVEFEDGPPPAQRPDRSPCPGCGTRSDLGCSCTAATFTPTVIPPRPGAIPPRPKGRARTFEEQLAAVAAGAPIITVQPLRRADPAMTLGGVGSGML